LPFNNASKNVYEQKIKSQMSFKPNLSTKKKTEILKNQPDEKTKIQKLAIKETQEEMKRIGNFKRVFPC
jgi:hypothetical protein